MGSHAPARQGPGVRVSKDTVAKRFIDMYFGILNTSHQLLYRFYRTDSSVTVSESMEDGTTLSESAETEEAVQELVKSIFADVTIKVETTVSQFSMEGSVLILVSGTITKSNPMDQMQNMDDGIQRMFSQAFLLAPQENGYYVLTDSMQIRGHSSCPILKKKTSEAAAAGYLDTHEYQRMVPRTPPNDGTQGRLPAELSLQSPVDFMDGRPPRSNHRRASSMDVPTPPQMHERWTEPPARSPPGHRGLTDRHSYARALSHGQTPGQQGPGRMGPQGAAATRNGAPVSGQLARAQSDRVDSSGGADSFAQGSPGLHRHRRRTASDTRFLQQQPLHGHGVFIARLPFGTESAEVVNVMGEFGTIVGGADGIQVRDGRNGCYAFVSYDTEESAEAAIRGPVKFGGKQVFIERKYSTVDGAVGSPSPVAKGRGRPGPGSRRTGSIG